MNFEDYSLDQLVDCLFDVLNNSDIPAETVVQKIKDTLENNRLDLQKKLDRTSDILKLLEQDNSLPYGFQTSENYDSSDGYEWTPLGAEDKIDFKFVNNKDNYEHSKCYWDRYRNK